jgi:hypothetical protein
MIQQMPRRALAHVSSSIMAYTIAGAWKESVCCEVPRALRITGAASPPKSATLLMLRQTLRILRGLENA